LGCQDTIAAAVVTGSERLAAAAFAPLKSKRVGLITNQTGRVGAHHVADLLRSARGPRLAAIFAP
jgi:hypothetical protein